MDGLAIAGRDNWNGMRSGCRLQQRNLCDELLLECTELLDPHLTVMCLDCLSPAVLTEFRGRVNAPTAAMLVCSGRQEAIGT